ncbi:hypothetical protein HORIV_68400 [Vreelandella olivaria]|uniref:Uncharacterized protein n=1 Tax=Vreelandella olivaria TaxID=390919 RepID=A0ABM7GTJ7_9GAMM|nr:hypothetical protein HORIV_68400 [Halomonas olivaria]
MPIVADKPGKAPIKTPTVVPTTIAISTGEKKEEVKHLIYDPTWYDPQKN